MSKKPAPNERILRLEAALEQERRALREAQAEIAGLRGQNHTLTHDLATLEQRIVAADHEARRAKSERDRWCAVAQSLGVQPVA